MSNARIKISADTGPLKKSLLEAKRAISDLNKTPKKDTEPKKPKESVISQKEAEQVFGGVSLTKENITKHLAKTKKELGDLIRQSAELSDSDEKQLELRKKINEQYKIQSTLMRDLRTVEEFDKESPSPSGGAKGKAIEFAKNIAKAVGVYAFGNIYRGTTRYESTVPDRVQLEGLGVSNSQSGIPRDRLSRSGINEEMLLAERLRMATQFGARSGGSDSAIQRLSFERAFGLERGSTSDMTAGLRSSFGSGSEEAMQQIQASVIAAKLTDGLDPYFKNLTSLLTEINESGFTQTTELTRIYTTLIKNGIRTPEQVTRMLTGLDAVLKSPSGEQEAFFQTAFAKANIGGSTLGGVRMAMGGGLFGLDENKFRGEFSKNMADALSDLNMFSGVSSRIPAVLNMAKEIAGLNKGESFSDIKGSREQIQNKIVQLDALAEFLGAKRGEGILFLSFLEKASQQQMSEADIKKGLDELRSGKLPDSIEQRLVSINKTLAGNTEVLSRNVENLVTLLGEGSQFMRNWTKIADAMGLAAQIETTNTLVDSVNSAKESEKRRLAEQEVEREKWRPKDLGDSNNARRLSNAIYDLIDWFKSDTRKTEILPIRTDGTNIFEP